MRCSPDGSGWKDQFGETVNSGLECLPGCVNPTHSLWDTYHSSNVTEKREYVFITDFEGHTLAECLTGASQVSLQLVQILLLAYSSGNHQARSGTKALVG